MEDASFPPFLVENGNRCSAKSSRLRSNWRMIILLSPRFNWKDIYQLVVMCFIKISIFFEFYLEK
jgi:hypothetical protein